MMTPSTSPEFDPETVAQVREATQQAVDATATAYTGDASIDVAARLRQELQGHGLDVDDDAWIDEVAHRIRSGHHLVVGSPEQDVGPDPEDYQDLVADQPAPEDRPGSIGGDHGGG